MKFRTSVHAIFAAFSIITIQESVVSLCYAVKNGDFDKNDSLILGGFPGILRRCVSCRSRGELGSCKDPFTMNSTQIALEKGVEAVPCVSGWCGKIIESQNLNNEYGTATQRLCFQRGPDDTEERCAYTVWNYRKVYMCLCYGDLCNGVMRISVINRFLITIAICLVGWLV